MNHCWHNNLTNFASCNRCNTAYTQRRGGTPTRHSIYADKIIFSLCYRATFMAKVSRGRCCWCFIVQQNRVQQPQLGCAITQENTATDSRVTDVVINRTVFHRKLCAIYSCNGSTIITTTVFGKGRVFYQQWMFVSACKLPCKESPAELRVIINKARALYLHI